MSDQTLPQPQTPSGATTLDVRPILANGEEPLALILETAESTPIGEPLLLIAPFEPVPLYGMLGARGFEHTTECVAADEWHVRFIRRG